MQWLRIPAKVTGHSGDRDRRAERSGAGGYDLDRSVTIGQEKGILMGLLI